MKVIAILGIGLWLCSCRGKPPQTPEETYRAFYHALEGGTLETAMEYFAPETRQAFARMGERLRRDGGPNAEPLQLFLEHAAAERFGPLRSIEVLERAPERVTLQVTAGPCGKDQECRVSRVTMVRADGGWKVAPELPPELTHNGS